MTSERDLKALVRARMAKTGESYVAARRQLLHARFAPLIDALDDRDKRVELIDQLRGALPASRNAAFDGLATGRTDQIRKGCAYVLDHAEQDQQVQRALMAALKDNHWRVRKAAVHALICAACKPHGCLSGKAIDVILDVMLRDRDRRVRLGCAGVLMFWSPTPELTAAFQRVFASDPAAKMRDRAAYYLAAAEFTDGAPERYWRRPEFWTRLAQLTPDNYLFATRRGLSRV
jgi:hypothetical protein